MGQSGVPESPERGVTLVYQRVRNESCWLPGLNRPQAQSLHVLLAFNADAQARKLVYTRINLESINVNEFHQGYLSDSQNQTGSLVQVLDADGQSLLHLAASKGGVRACPKPCK